MESSIVDHSSDSEGQTFRTVILCVTILNLFTTTLGGYYFLGRYEARLLQTEQKYTEVKHQISEIELEFSKAIAEQELNSNHLDTALRSIRILNDAKPKAILTVTEEKLDWCGEQQLCIPLVINNTTNFEIKVTLDSIDFFSEAKRGSSDKLELEWNHNPLRTFEISANSTQKHVMRPTLSVLKSMTLYYTIEYSAKPLETTRSLLLKTAKLLKIDIPKGQFEYKASYSASIRLK